MKSLPDMKYAYDYRIREPDDFVARISMEFCKCGSKFYMKQFVDGSRKDVSEMVSFDGATYYSLDRNKRLKIASNYNDIETDSNSMIIMNPIFNVYYYLLMQDLDAMESPLFADMRGWLKSLSQTQISVAKDVGGDNVLVKQQFGSKQITQESKISNLRPYPTSIRAKTTWESVQQEYRERDITSKWDVEKELAVKIDVRSIWLPSKITHRIFSLHMKDEAERPGAYDIQLDESSFRLLTEPVPDEEFRVPQTIAKYIHDVDSKIEFEIGR